VYDVVAVVATIGGPRVGSPILCVILPNRFRTPLIVPNTCCVPIDVSRVLIGLAVFVRIRSTVADASECLLVIVRSDQRLFELGAVQSPGFVVVLVLLVLVLVACERAGTASIAAAVNLTVAVTVNLTVALVVGTVVATMTVIAGSASFRG